MKKWISDQACTGCGACENICTAGALHLAETQHGFLRPQIDSDICIDCGRCAAVCPVRQKLEEDTHPVSRGADAKACYAGWAADEECRATGSSGSVFAVLATKTLEEGGCVAGAAYRDDFSGVCHVLVQTPEALEALKRSKYVQSETGSVFRQVGEQLDMGRQVLFAGAPCQVAGLYAYLGEQAENPLLTTMDFICHGVNSPMAYRAWLKELAQEHGSAVTALSFRDKQPQGWRSFHVSVGFKNGDVYSEKSLDDPFMQAFLLHDLMVRPSCTECLYKGLDRMADLTLADFWGAEGPLNDPKGVSMIITHTEKGQALLNSVADRLVLNEQPLLAAGKGNPSLFNAVQPSSHAEMFLSQLEAGIPFREAFGSVVKAKDEALPLLSVLIPCGEKDAAPQPLVEALSGQLYGSMQIVLADGTADGRYQPKEEEAGVEYIAAPGAEMLELVAKGMDRCNGEYIHICDTKTLPAMPKTYQQAVAQLKQHQADAGCFGWLDEYSRNPAKNGYCGAGDGYLLMDAVLDGNDTAGDRTYGGWLFNKLFSRSALEAAYPEKDFFREPLADLGVHAFWVRLAEQCQTVCFQATPLFHHLEVPSMVGNTIPDPDALFDAEARWLRRIEETKPALFDKAAQTCFAYELALLAQANNRGWVKLSQKLYQHISSYYAQLIDRRSLLEALIATTPDKRSNDQQLASLRHSKVSLTAAKTRLEKENSRLRIRNEKLADRQVWIEGKNQTLDNRNKRLEERQAWMQSKNEALDKRNKRLEERQAWIQSKNEALDKRNQRLVERQEWIQGKNDTLTEKCAALEKERNELLAIREKLELEKTTLQLKQDMLLEEQRLDREQIAQYEEILSKGLVRTAAKLHGMGNLLPATGNGEPADDDE